MISCRPEQIGELPEQKDFPPESIEGVFKILKVKKTTLKSMERCDSSERRRKEESLWRKKCAGVKWAQQGFEVTVGEEGDEH